MPKSIILDRDGVINYDSDEYIKSPEEWKAIPGSLEAIARLNQAGYRVILITNQSGLARGLFNIETLHKIHNKMHKQLSEVGGTIEATLFCPHGPNDNCNCRKPLPGLFHEFANRLAISLTNVPAVGDSLRDLQAARTAGAQPILVLTGKGTKTVNNRPGFEDVPIYKDLATFVDDFLNNLTEKK